MTEVLVALLIMSIGIVSLTTMFPLSILRSIKASQLTKGTDLRYNAEALLALNPSMITDPNADGIANVAFPDYYIVDPLGWNFVNGTTTPALAATFGNDQGTVFPSNFVAGVNIGGVSRYHVGRNTPALADYLVTLPDTWVLQAEAPAGPLATRVTAPVPSGPTEIVANGFGGIVFTMTPGVTSRIVIFGADGVSSHVRRLTATPGGNRMLWTEDIDDSGALNGAEDLNNNGVLDDYALPTGFVPATVRIDSQEQRYTWLLTCRKTASAVAADVDVTVFFGRSADNPADDEALYLTQRFGAGTKVINVDYSAYPQAPAAKRGGFMFDANNARWYRITSIDDNKAGLMRVGIEVPTYAPSPAAGGRVMFPKGVVDVYPLGTKTAL